MSTCPHCGETLQEGARFCPYCMTSLDEKTVVLTHTSKKRRLLAVSAVLLLLIAVLGGILLWPTPGTPPTDAGGPTTTTTTSSTGENGETGTPVGGGASSGSTGSTGNASGTTSATTVGGPSSSVETPVVTTPQAVTYTYITATPENAYPWDCATPTPFPDGVVITRVHGVAADGVYDVPATLGGKPVLAIRPAAFADVGEYVSSVILPASIRTVWSGAFPGCYDMTDVYFRSSVITVFVDAFPPSYKRTGTLTVHSKYDCRDHDFYYLRNIVGDFDAQWAQWNG